MNKKYDEPLEICPRAYKGYNCKNCREKDSCDVSFYMEDEAKIEKILAYLESIADSHKDFSPESPIRDVDGIHYSQIPGSFNTIPIRVGH